MQILKHRDLNHANLVEHKEKNKQSTTNYILIKKINGILENFRANLNWNLSVVSLARPWTSS